MGFTSNEGKKSSKQEKEEKEKYLLDKHAYSLDTKVRQKKYIIGLYVLFLHIMRRNGYVCIFICTFFMFVVGEVKCWAQDIGVPTAAPMMLIEEDEQEIEYDTYSGSAPVRAHFTSNVKDLGNYVAYYEWRVFESGKEDDPKLLRYDQNIDYEFLESGTFYVRLYVTFIQGLDTIEYKQEDPYSIEVSTSKLEMPNAFSPNGDMQNDVYRAKEGYQSIVSFHAYIFNRWGKKLYEWNNIEGGWDGTYNGKKVKDGVYFCWVKAKGADGKKYSIKTDVNLLSGNGEKDTTTGD